MCRRLRSLKLPDRDLGTITTSPSRKDVYVAISQLRHSSVPRNGNRKLEWKTSEHDRLYSLECPVELLPTRISHVPKKL